MHENYAKIDLIYWVKSWRHLFHPFQVLLSSWNYLSKTSFITFFLFWWVIFIIMTIKSKCLSHSKSLSQIVLCFIFPGYLPSAALKPWELCHTVQSLVLAILFLPTRWHETFLSPATFDSFEPQIFQSWFIPQLCCQEFFFSSASWKSDIWVLRFRL